MRIFRMILQVGVFLFLAGYFLMLVTSTKIQLANFFVNVPKKFQTQDYEPKLSPIEMLRHIECE